MNTISNVLQDISRGCTANNLNEDAFSYRIVYFVNFKSGSEKVYIDTRYEDLQTVLENIVKGNLTTQNSVVIAAVTVRKHGEIISLLSRSYGYDLNEYFRQICEEKSRNSIYSSHGRRYGQCY